MQKKTLKWQTTVPAGVPIFTTLLDTAKRIDERTNGQVKVECYGLNQMVPEMEVLGAVRSGELDLGFTQSGYFGKSGVIPRSEAGQLPIWPSGQAGCAFVKAVVDKYIRNDMAAVGVVPIVYQINCCDDFGHFFATYHAHIWLNKMYSSLADAKGARVFVQHEVSSTIVSALGMIPQPMSFFEVPSALSKNEIDGAVLSNVTAWGLVRDLAVCCLKIDYPQCEDNFTIMNKKTYDSLPADIRNVITEELKNWETSPALDRAPSTKMAWNFWDQKEKDGQVKMVELSPSEKAWCREQWERKSVEGWVKNHIAAGFKDAQAYIDDLLKIRDSVLKSGLPQYIGYIA